MDALQRKEAEQSACSKVHETLLCNVLVKMEITYLLGLTKKRPGAKTLPEPSLDDCETL